MSTPHVLHVIRTLGRGGMERNLRRLVLETLGRELSHTILLLDDQLDVLEFPREVAILRAVTPPRDPRMPILIARALRQVKPTVIHARNWGAWPDTAVARMLAMPKVPLIFSYHGMEGSSVTWAQRLKFRLMAPLTTRIFAVSHAARDLLVEKYGLPRRRVGVLLNGVDVERFSPELPVARAPERRLVIGSVGRFFSIKNYPLLLAAVRRVLGSGLDVELRIAGVGPEFRTTVELARSAGLGDRLSCPGDIDEVPEFLRGLDVFVLSSDNEANPNALLEAMACGLACVSTDVGGVREVLAGGDCGLLVPPRDEVALAEAIERLLRTPDLRRALGDQARRRVIARYDQRRMYSRYLELYQAPLTAPLE